MTLLPLGTRSSIWKTCQSVSVAECAELPEGTLLGQKQPALDSSTRTNTTVLIKKQGCLLSYRELSALSMCVATVSVRSRKVCYRSQKTGQLVATLQQEQGWRHQMQLVYKDSLAMQTIWGFCRYFSLLLVVTLTQLKSLWSIKRAIWVIGFLDTQHLDAYVGCLRNQC